MKPTLLSLAVLLFAQWVVFMPTEVSAADETLPVFLCVGGSNMIGGRSNLEDLPKELKCQQATALFFDGTQWLPLSAEQLTTLGYGCEVSFASLSSDYLGSMMCPLTHSYNSRCPSPV